MSKTLFRAIAKGFLGRFLAYISLALGFWLLFQGFQSGNLSARIPFGLAGAASILIGMYLMVSIWGRGFPATLIHPNDEEDVNGDSVTGSN